MSAPEQDAVLACCLTAYGHPLSSLLFGESLHPGGLALTSRLAELAGVSAETRVLDAGSGTGASTVHLADQFGCQIVGVTIEPEGAEMGTHRAGEQAVSERVRFVRGNLNDPDLEVGTFDVVFMECVLSIQPDKRATLNQVRSLLNPGGILAMSDVTIDPNAFPDRLHDLFAAAGCLNGAVRLREYQDLARQAGFTIEAAQGLPEMVELFLMDLKGRMLFADAALALGKLPESASQILKVVKSALSDVQELVARDQLGYGLVVARA